MTEKAQRGRPEYEFYGVARFQIEHCMSQRWSNYLTNRIELVKLPVGKLAF